MKNDKKTTLTINQHQKPANLLDIAGDITLQKACETIGNEKGLKLVELFGKCKGGDKDAYKELEILCGEYATKQVEVIRSN